MKVIPKFDDVPFREAAVYRLCDKAGGSTEYPCACIDCVVNGVPHSYLVASVLAQGDESVDDEEIAYYAESEETLKEILFAILVRDDEVERAKEKIKTAIDTLVDALDPSMMSEEGVRRLFDVIHDAKERLGE